jgi:hypothetical protein
MQEGVAQVGPLFVALRDRVLEYLGKLGAA